MSALLGLVAGWRWSLRRNYQYATDLEHGHTRTFSPALRLDIDWEKERLVWSSKDGDLAQGLFIKFDL